MANISGTYFDPSPGRLQVTFTANAYVGSNADAGHPSGGQNFVMRAIVNGVPTPEIDFNNRSCVMVMDYPGGVNWAVSTAEVTHSGGGTAVYGMNNLTLVLELTKK